MKRIVVEPPTSDTRRERVERRVFEQLAAVRVIDRADAAMPSAPPSRPRWMVGGLGLAIAAAATIALVVFVGTHSGGDAREREATAPSRIVTPIGGASKFTLGNDAVIDAGSDTSVEVQTDNGGITLVLARGSVDCDVAPRAGRPPFHVVAGDVSVEVVGTRFTVTRTPSPRVDVTRGKVKVTAPGGTWLVAAGKSWTPPEQTADASSDAPAAVAPVVADEIAPEAPDAATETAPKPKAKPRAKAEDPIALYDRIDAHVTTDPASAVREADEFLRRFPHSATVEDVTWLRIQALLAAHRLPEAGRAATDYLKQFPHGTYGELAARIAAQK